MKRRQFLQITVAGSLAFSLPGIKLLSGHHAPWHPLAHPGLLSFLDDRRVWEIGSTYRRVFPQENAPETLRGAILADRGMSEDLTASNLQQCLDQQVQNDFTRGHTVQVNGWILSVTEARQCALYSLVVA